MISEKAEIHPNAKIAKDVQIGPWTVIGDNVEIGEGCRIDPHVVIKGPTKIGKGNHIHSFSSVGDDPQDTTYKGEPTRLEIGDENMIREYCTLSRGTTKGGGITRIGNKNFFMTGAHIAHDCQVGDNTVFANNSALSGHVIIEDYAIIGAYSAIHQFCRIGAHAFVAKATYVTKDVLPYIIVAGNNPSAYGINSRGLRSRGFDSAAVDALRRAYKVIFRKGLTVQESVIELDKMASNHPEIHNFIVALKRSSRGIVR